jgi:hypothetical protein
MRRLVFLVLGFLLLFSAVVWAQDTANIVGSVTDPSGSAIPNAKVKVENPERGFVRNLVSDSAGEYTVVAIPIGNYTVTGVAPGFQRLVRTGLQLSAGQTLRVDLKLQVGAVTEAITVSGNVVHVETESAAISDLVSSTQIADLNLNGRNYAGLTMLTPGAVEDNSYDPSHLGHGGGEIGVSFNGSREEYSNLELDGGNDSDEGSGANGGDVTPSLNSIAEFRISTSNYGADVGQHAGALIEVATKAGTKDFHGNLHEFVRNDIMDANDWFINQEIAPPGGNAPKTPLKWNIFGGTFGGPFFIPGHYNTSRTKTFFFYSEEVARYREGTVIDNNVPTTRMLQGDFSECDPSSPNQNPIIIGQGCTLPTINGQTVDTLAQAGATLDPNAVALLKAYVPPANNGIDGYVAAHDLPTNFREDQIRVDQNISDKVAVFVRFSNDSWDQLVTPALWTGASYDTTVTNFNVPARQAVMHLTYTFKPNLMNEFIAAYADDPHTITPLTGPSSSADSVFKPSSWTATNLFAANESDKLLPGVTVGGGTPFGFYQDSGAFAGPYNTNPITTYKDNLAYTRGKHTLKMGFYLEKYQKNEQFLGVDNQGNYNFSTSMSQTTGNALADMFLADVYSYQEGTINNNGVPVGGYGHGHWRRTDFEPYFQDDWKVSPKLTLNLGVRYYLFIPFHDVTRPTLDSSFVPSGYNPAVEALLDADGNLVINSATGNVQDYTTYGNGLVQCGVNGIVAGCQHLNRRNIGPRFGFAYDPTGHGKTVLRGGYGIYYEPGNGNESNTEGLEGNPPAAFSPTLYNYVGFQTIQPITTGESLSSIPIPPEGISTIPYYQKPPSVQQYSLSVQHEFSTSDLLTAAFVGNQGRHLATARNLNQLPLNVSTAVAPELAGLTGTSAANPAAGVPGDLGQQICDPAGNCNVQTALIYNEVVNEFFVPYRGYLGISQKQNTAISNYNALQVNFRHTTSHGLTAQVSYTWAHTMDDSTSTYFSTGVDDNFDLRRWYATSDLSRSQSLVMNYVYNLPFFKNTPSALVKHTLAGWEVSGITSFFLGLPTDFGCGVSGYSTGIGGGVRCNTVGKLQIHKSVIQDPQFGPIAGWFDPTVITQPNFNQLAANGEPGMFGYQGRNAIIGPGRNNWDLALLKNFQMPWFKGEHSKLQFRAETFNTFNHPQWKGFNAGCASTITFGQPCTQTGNAEVNGDWGPRLIQLGMQFDF